MESVNGVDVSWLHHSQKGPDGLRKDVASREPPKPPLKDSPPNGNTAIVPPSSTIDQHKHFGIHNLTHHHHNQPEPSTEILPQTQTQTPIQTQTTSKPQEKKGPPPPLSRKSSWISSLSSKFSSSSLQSPTTPSSAPRQNENAVANNASTAANPTATPTRKADPTTNASNSPKSSPGFLQSAFRRLSSSGGSMGKASGYGAIVPRKVLNVDIYRERCSISELQPGKLRRVSFCVDVEIAGHAAPLDEDDAPPPTPSKINGGDGNDDMTSKKTQGKIKLKEKAEGEALKHPVSLEEGNNSQTDPAETVKQIAEAVAKSADDNVLPPPDGTEKPPTTRKKEKKKRSEEERKERKEKKRQAALANGSIPMEFKRDYSSSESPSGASTPRKAQDRPTIDPLRIYRRCCQLRETAPLKKIAEQLSAPGVSDEFHPGTVTCLYLSGSRFQFSDIVTLGDYLAVVPVRKLIMEDCGLTDEAIRVILAGLLAVKTAAQAQYNKDLPRTPDKTLQQSEDRLEKLGVIEKLSFKNNPQIGPNGWKHISCFINMSRTLKAIDLSMIPFPSASSKPQQNPTATQPSGQTVKDTTTPVQTSVPTPAPNDIGATFEKCLRERKGARLEELVMAEANLTPETVRQIVNAVKVCGVSRLGLASNGLNPGSIAVVADYLKTGQCEGLDLGGNFLSEDSLNVLVEALEESRPQFCALSVADTGLTTTALKILLPKLAQLPNFRFIDLSHNKELFGDQSNCVNLLRRWLPRMPLLKRVNLNDVAMSSEDCISLAEVLPEIPMLAHLSILENPALTALASATEESSREEACALYASLLAATRVSKTIVSVDIDVPTPEAGEIVQALAKQMVAYSLRNVERNLAIANDDENYEEKAVHFPDILLHIVGHDDLSGDTENDPAPDDDYIVGGTGVAKALTVCLGNRLANDTRRHSSHASPSASGTTTPTVQATSLEPRSKAMSVNLLSNARKIRSRLQPAIANEEATGDEMALRRLKALDSTLANIIQRFEDEYPETRLPQAPTELELERTSTNQTFKNPFDTADDADGDIEDDEDLPITEIHPPGRLSRHGSEVDIYSKHLAQEEGNMHRFGQKLRRDILRPQTQDYHHGTTGLEQEPEYMMRLRARLEQLSGPEIQNEIQKNGLENVLKAIGRDAEQLKHVVEADPEAWKQFQTAHGNAYSAENSGGQNVAVGD